MRESIFSSIGSAIEEANVADLFAGTGSYGLEALSRGAKNVDFFENNRAALTTLKANISKVSRSCRVETTASKIHANDIFRIKTHPKVFDFIFLDPPYEIITETLTRIFSGPIEALTQPQSLVILELPGNLEPKVEGWILTKRLGKLGRDKPTAAFFSKEQ